MPAATTKSIQQAIGPSRKRLFIAFIAGMALTALAALAPAIAELFSPGPDSYSPQPVAPGLHQEIGPGTEMVRTTPLPGGLA